VADPFLERYVRGEFAAFFPVAVGDTGAALALERPIDRPGLAAALRPHAERLGASEAAMRSLERLAHPESRVVVTGQQTGLLLGPLFTLSKAHSAIRLAEELDSDDRPVVPLFWLASQDHDRDEIDHAYLLDMAEELMRVEVALPEATPSGRMPLTAATIAAVEEQLGRFEGPSVHRGACLALLRRAAERSSTFADWFGAQLYELLGGSGLLVVDPLDPAVAERFAPLLRRELEEPEASVAAVNGAGARLRALGFAPQLGRAADATNLFLELRDGTRSERVALRRRGDAFVAGGRRLERADLLAILDDDPSAVTPAAGLRPIAQDYALPTAATVVGPGELRYFAQLSGVFEHHGVPMSLVWPRTEATLIEPPVRRILARYGLDAHSYADDPDGALERVVLALTGHAERFDGAAATLKRESGALIAAVEAFDPTLAGAVDRARGRIERTLSKLRSQGAAAVARRDGVIGGQFGRLRAQLLPAETRQERLLSPYSGFLKFGIGPVMDRFSTLPSSGRHLLDIDGHEID
jgi:bacillithiol biosynthesis cysteine-adding enzyme BshC